MKSNLYFKHDLYALDDTKLRRLVLKHGAVGYATFFETVAKLMKEETHRCEMSFLVSDLAYALHEDEAKIASALEYSVSCGLFMDNDGFLESERVNRTCDEFSEYSHKQSENARKRWESRSNTTASNGNATAMPPHSNRNATAMPIKEIEIEKENKNNNLGSPSQEDNPSINTKKITDKTEIVCSEPSNELKLEADNPIEKPVFITIIAKSGKEVPIYQDMVDLWKDAFRAVDVEGQLREMKVWSVSHKSERKTEKGMLGFINNWLSKEQDKPSFRGGKDRNDFYGGKYIKGTNIRMDITASGDRSQYNPNDRLEDIL